MLTVRFESKRPEKRENRFMGRLTQFRWFHNFSQPPGSAFQKTFAILISMIYLPEDQPFSAKDVITDVPRVCRPASNMVIEHLFSLNKFLTFLTEENVVLTAFSNLAYVSCTAVKEVFLDSQALILLYNTGGLNTVLVPFIYEVNAY